MPSARQPVGESAPLGAFQKALAPGEAPEEGAPGAHDVAQPQGGP